MQFPSDNWVAQEIICEIKPDVILEIGTGEGGTTLFYAAILEKVNEQGKVITVSSESPDTYRRKLEVKLLKKGYSETVRAQQNAAKAYEYKLWKEKIMFIAGNSEDPAVIDKIIPMIQGRKALILLDAQESKIHMSKDLTHYALPVAAGSYIIVHDTVKAEVYEAVQQFVKHNDNFQIDHSRERFLITLSPSGFLKKVSSK
jgi:cephalosporin hydroxylase